MAREEARAGPGRRRSASLRSSRRTAGPRSREADKTVPPSSRHRFLAADRYRVEREWLRYEGTPQRDLFRELRERFLLRHATGTGWAVDLGSGPLRFTPLLGGEHARCVALDLSAAMLRQGPVPANLADRWPIERVQGDAVRPPLRPHHFATVGLLGNALGFAGSESIDLLSSALSLVAPGGRVLIEIAPGPGEHSRYLARLPEGAVGRLLRSPPPLVGRRIRAEGFLEDPPRRVEPGTFARWDPRDLATELVRRGFAVEETLSVAPALGSDPTRVAAARGDPKAWARLLELEESLGRDPERWPRAAAVLVAAALPPGGMIM